MENIIKRFQFDLDMGIFKLYHQHENERCYMFKCNGKAEYEFLYSLLHNKMSYYSLLRNFYGGGIPGKYTEAYNAIAIEVPAKVFNECYISEKSTKYNELPDYMKEYIRNGSQL